MKRMTTASHSKQFFTDINEFVELLLGTIQSSEKRMYCSKADWIELINFIYADKKELIKCYL
jgi:hypothetical protein